MKCIIVFLALLTSCNSSKTTPEQNTLDFDVILERATGGKTTKDIVVVSDKNALEQIYNGINSNQEPGYQIPEINFETESVIVFFLGEKNTGGYSISVRNISESKNSISVFYQEKGPKLTDMVTMVITQPYCIVKTKKLSKELKFIKTD